MGLQIKDLIVKKEIAVKDLKGKILAVDANNNLYQYLTTIRSPDGSVLTNRKGVVTSHLIGLFTRSTALMEEGIKLVFVFDGKAPEIKKKTAAKRMAAKQEASLKFQTAADSGELADMKKYASRTAVLNREMVEDAKKIITALGLPIVQAPSEGEAQTAHMVKKGRAYASVSQDYDNLIFSCPVLVRNLSIAGKRKIAGTLGYQTVKPELIFLQDVLTHLNIDQEQLILLAMLVGTDYNPGGIKGIGPKNALKLVKEYHHRPEGLFDKVEWARYFPEISWGEVLHTIQNISVTDDFELDWASIHEKELTRLLVEEYDFSLERVKSRLEKLHAEKSVQKGLGSFL